MSTMMIDRAVAIQALKVMEANQYAVADQAPHGDVMAYNAATEALRAAALAQEQDEPVAWLQPKTVDGYSRPDLGYETCSKDDYGAFPVYRASPKAEPEQEPVAWYQKRGQEVLTSHPTCWGREDEPWTPLYAAPPQRKPLTEEEIDRICASLGFAAISPAEIVRAVERAHGIGETK